MFPILIIVRVFIALPLITKFVLWFTFSLAKSNKINIPSTKKVANIIFQRSEIEL